MRELRNADKYSTVYKDVYRSLTHRLTKADSLKSSRIRALSDQGVPRSLIDYYAIAGSARSLHSAYDKLSNPDDLITVHRRTIFYSEHQGACRYGYAANHAGDDPPVYMSCDRENAKWYKVCQSISDFLTVMLLWNATFGGALKFSGDQLVSANFQKNIVKSGVSYRGLVNGMKGYSSRGFAICFVKWGWAV